MHKRTTLGTFARVHKLWTPRKWDDGYFDNRGRFRVYRPDYPRAYSEGYALRAHVVYWLKTGKAHPVGYVLHHKDENKANDRFSNLELIGHGDHTRKHKTVFHKFICKHCNNVFVATGQNVARRRSEGRSIKFCSKRCFDLHPKSAATKRKVSISLKKAYAEGRR